MPTELPTVSLFSGAMGLDQGLTEAGFDVRVAVECNPAAVATIRANLPNVSIPTGTDGKPSRLEDIPTDHLLRLAHLSVGEAAVLTGGPSCQSFSTAGHRKSFDDPRGTMFGQFLRVLTEAQPRFFVMENVRGILSAAILHRPLKERGPGHPPLEPAEELGSAFRLMLRRLRETGYHVVFDLLNAADYGVPQRRERVIVIGSRDGEPVRMPPPTHSQDGSGGLIPWVTLREAVGNLDESHSYRDLSPKKRRFLEMVPEGGNWNDIPDTLQEEAMGKAYVSWGGRSGFYRRLSWDKPAPALTTRPDSKATMFCHPDETRPLSVEEYRAIQQFPESWQFGGSIAQQYVQIGNAVPIGLGSAIGRAIVEAIQAGPIDALRGTVTCYNEGLLDRLAKRPRTVLDPDRMRKVKGAKAARAWMAKGRDEDRIEVRDIIDSPEEIESLTLAP